MRTFVILGGLAAASTAFGQGLTIDSDWMIEPVPGTFYENGVGAPTVAYVPDEDLWVMLFETRFPDAGDCGANGNPGRWGIGRATSTDGLNWTVDADAVLEPATDSFYSCVVAHPVTIYDEATDITHMWFKAHQNTTACDNVDSANPEPAWGCENITGVGHATSTDHGETWTVEPEPELNLSDFGFPAITKVNDVYYMLLAYNDPNTRSFELWQSLSGDDGATWTDPAFVMGGSATGWVYNEVYNPALTCFETGASPFDVFFGGRETDASFDPIQNQWVVEILYAGVGQANSGDTVSWLQNVLNPYITWDLAAVPPEKDWRHWDAMRINNDHLLYFSEKDDNGRNRVGLAYTYTTQQTAFNEANINPRICAWSNDTGITGSETDSQDDPTDSNVETESESDSESGDSIDTNDSDNDTDPTTGEGGGCCKEDGDASTGWMALPLLLLWRRRRN